MSIKIKAQEQSSSVFKSGTQRFQTIIEEALPGPGQYELGPGQYELTHSRQKHAKSQTVFPQYQIANLKATVPSIPVDNLGFK